MSWDKALTIQEQVQNLLDAGFIQEVMYSTWLSNVAMVKKSNEKWRMCIDYTNLNKACLKDSYSLPSIDGLVDAASDFRYPVSILRGLVLGIYPDPNSPQRWRKDDIHHPDNKLLLQSYAIWTEEHKGHISKINEQGFCRLHRNLDGNVHSQYVGENNRGWKIAFRCQIVFNCLHKHEIRLNPQKCTFTVELGSS